jgi:hypothetical protein
MERVHSGWLAFQGVWTIRSWQGYIALATAAAVGLACALHLGIEWVPDAWARTFALFQDSVTGFLIAMGAAIGGVVGCVNAFATPEARKEKAPYILGGIFGGAVVGFCLSFVVTALAAVVAGILAVLVAIVTGGIAGILAGLAVMLLVAAGVFFWTLAAGEAPRFAVS